MSKEWDAVEFYTSTVSINGGPGLTINEALRALAAEARKQALMEAADIQRELDEVVAVLSEQQQNEYICKCGIRVVPHRCSYAEEF